MDEYISRDDVLRKFIEGDGHDDDRFTEGYNFAVQEYREEVKKIPSADVQPIRHGYWSECYTDSHHYSGICSVCGGGAIRKVKGKPLDYCSNCGARMDLEEGENNED